jgi:hypothetical protein
MRRSLPVERFPDDVALPIEPPEPLAVLKGQRIPELF